MLATALAACGDDDDAEPTTSDTAGTPSATTPPEGSAAGAEGPTADDLAAVAATYADLVAASYDAVDRVGHRDADRDRRLPRRPDRRDARRGQAGVAHRSRRLRPDRGVPLLRRPDRQPRRRSRGPDQRLADGRGVRRLRRGRCRRPASSTTPPTSPRSPPTSSSRPTRRAARRTSRPAGTRSSSCCGVRTCRRTVPANGRSPTTRRRPNAERRATYLQLLTDLLVDDLSLGRRPVGARRRLPHRVPRRSEALAVHATPPRHRRPVAWRARRRADGRRLRDQGPRGRALLLQRQHRPPTSSTTPGHAAWCTWPTSRASTGPSPVRPRRGGRPELDAAAASASSSDVGGAHQRVLGPFETMIAGLRTRPGQRGAARRARRVASRTRATQIAEAAAGTSDSRSPSRSDGEHDVTIDGAGRLRRAGRSSPPSPARRRRAPSDGASDDPIEPTAPAARRADGRSTPRRRRASAGSDAFAQPARRTLDAREERRAFAVGQQLLQRQLGDRASVDRRAATASARCSTPSRARRATSATAAARHR